MKQRGTIRFYNVRRGHGFIDTDDGQSVFVENLVFPLGADDRVEFDVRESIHGLEAVNVVELVP